MQLSTQLDVLAFLVEAASPLGRVKQLIGQLKNKPQVRKDFVGLLCNWLGLQEVAPEQFTTTYERELSKDQSWVPLLMWIVKHLKIEEANKAHYDEILHWLEGKGNIEVLVKYVKDRQVNMENASLYETLPLAHKLKEGELDNISEDHMIRQSEQKRSAGKPPIQGEILYKYKDGWTLQKLDSKLMLVDETVYLDDICVGKDDYGWPKKCLVDKYAVIVSLRDDKGFPIANISYGTADGQIDEIVEAANRTPSTDSLVRIYEAIQNDVFPTTKQRLVDRKLASSTSIGDYPDMMKMLARNRSETVRINLASNPALSALPEQVIELSDDDETEVRRALASNTSIGSFPESAVRKLAKDSSASVLARLAQNSSLSGLPNDVVSYLATVKHTYVSDYLASNPSVTEFPEAVKLLVNSPYWTVRQSLCRSSDVLAKLSKEDVLQLAEDRSVDVLAALASNHSLRLFPDAVAKLANAKNNRVLLELEYNPDVQVMIKEQRNLKNNPQASMLVEAGPAILKNLKKQFPDRAQELDELAKKDPSGDKYAYLEWMWKQVRSGAKAADVIEKIEEFHPLAEDHKVPFKAKDLKDLDRVLEENASKMIEVRTKKQHEANKDKDPVLLYDKGGYKVLELFKHDDVCELGEGTTWCIRLKDANYFRDYNTPGTRFLFITSPSGERRMAIIQQQHGQKNEDAFLEELRNENQRPGDDGEHAEHLDGTDVNHNDFSRRILEELGFTAYYKLSSYNMERVADIFKQGKDDSLAAVLKYEVARDRDSFVYPEMVLTLAQDSDHRVRWALLQTTFLSGKLAGGNEELATKLTSIFSKDPEPSIREHLAIYCRNPTPEIVLTLARDTEKSVRRALSSKGYIRVSPEAVLLLAQDSESSVIYALSENPSIEVSPEAVLLLAHVGAPGMLSRNPAIRVSPEAVLLLARDDVENKGGRTWLATNPAIEVSPEAILLLARDAATYRYLLINPSDKVQEILKQMKQEPQASYTSASFRLLNRLALVVAGTPSSMLDMFDDGTVFMENPEEDHVAHTDPLLPPYDRSMSSGNYMVVWLGKTGPFFSSRCSDLLRARALSLAHRRLPSWIVRAREDELDALILTMDYRDPNGFTVPLLDRELRSLVEVKATSNTQDSQSNLPRRVELREDPKQ